ncbi:MAG: hypothetical protein AABY22_37165, partial [Nanoarchaeota archaeon]
MNKTAKISIYIIILLAVALSIIFIPEIESLISREDPRINISYNQGNSLNNVSYGIVSIAGRKYTPDCLTECHLPIKIKYDGSIALPFSILSNTDLSTSFRGQDRTPNNIHVDFLNTSFVNVTDYSLTCNNYIVSNVSGSFTFRNCSRIVNGSHLEERNDWIRLPNTLRLVKGEYYYFDIVGEF